MMIRIVKMFFMKQASYFMQRLGTCRAGPSKDTKYVLV